MSYLLADFKTICNLCSFIPQKQGKLHCSLNLLGSWGRCWFRSQPCQGFDCLFVSYYVDGKSNQIWHPLLTLKGLNHPQIAFVTIRSMDKQTLSYMVNVKRSGVPSIPYPQKTFVRCVFQRGVCAYQKTKMLNRKWQEEEKAEGISKVQWRNLLRSPLEVMFKTIDLLVE